MKNLYIILSIAILFEIVVQPARSQNVIQRNLSLYEKSGHYDLKLNLGYEERNRMKTKIRNFLWSHWREKQRGYLTANVYTIEGDPRTVKLFVEPDSKSHWQVVAEYVGVDYSRGGIKGKPHRWSSTEVYRIIERYERNENNIRTGSRIADEQIVTPERYVLVLKESPSANERGW